jgi:cation transport protein ChaC
MSLDETAETIAGASGVLGSNRDYLEQMAAQLQCLGIDDAYVSALMQRVRCVAPV